MKEISELQLQIQQQERTNQTLDQQTAVTQSLNEQIALNDERVK